ncbi:acyloxyacyl hydrolase [Acidimangrovimonas sediminis]|uniref:acyloxyacyl hydrolase n=1 Tax=Acidimangrovimonas sediminis TaxID=2056283 RepID=UPI000C7FE120|nr:acyloxyacyl hydrolase [Acidimangrovimonas sediminis]
MGNMRHLAFVLLCTALTGPAHAAEWSLTPGVENFSAVGAPTKPALSFELQASPLRRSGRWRFGLGGAVSWDGAGDLWAGAGLVVRYEMKGWYVEVSGMPGVYHVGSDATDLGGPLEFRSLLGIGYRLTPTNAVMLEIHHRSSADIYSYNPGVNGVGLRFTQRF